MSILIRKPKNTRKTKQNAEKTHKEISLINRVLQRRVFRKKEYISVFPVEKKDSCGRGPEPSVSNGREQWNLRKKLSVYIGLFGC